MLSCLCAHESRRRIGYTNRPAGVGSSSDPWVCCYESSWIVGVVVTLRSQYANECLGPLFDVDSALPARRTLGVKAGNVSGPGDPGPPEDRTGTKCRVRCINAKRRGPHRL